MAGPSLLPGPFSHFRPLQDPQFGSFSVSQHIRHLNDHPGEALLCCSVHQALKRPPSLGSFSCAVLMCGEREAIEMVPPLCVTQQYHPVSVFAWLSFTSISHCDLLPWVPSGYHSAGNSPPCPRIALQSLCSRPQLLHFLGDLSPCPGTYGCGRIVCVILIPSGLSQISYFTIQQPQMLHLCSKLLP